MTVRKLIFICPECKYSMSMDVKPLDYMHGGFGCECGTVIQFTLDSRLSVEQARHDKLVVEWRALQAKRDQQETPTDGR